MSSRRAKTQAGGFIGTCIDLSRRDLEEYDDSERDIGYRRFAQLAGPDLIRELNEGRTPRMSKDRCLQFGRGEWKGKPCICLYDSCIHNLWYLKPRSR